MGQSLLFHFSASDLHAYIRAPCTYWEGFHSSISLVTDSPWCFKAFEKIAPIVILATTLTLRKKYKTTEPRSASLESSVQKQCNIGIQQSFNHNFSLFLPPEYRMDQLQHGPSIIYSLCCCFLSHTTARPDCKLHTSQGTVLDSVFQKAWMLQCGNAVLDKRIKI